MAGDSRGDAGWDSVLANNIIGTRNIYEAAKQNGVKRIVFASSNHVTGGYEGIPPALHRQPERRLIRIEDEIRPDGFYAVSKSFGEAIARMYYELHSIQSICLRIGTVVAHDDPTRDDRHASTWLSYRDLIQLFEKSISSPKAFGTYYGVSNNDRRFWDISNAQAELGYMPVDNASLGYAAAGRNIS